MDAVGTGPYDRIPEPKPADAETIVEAVERFTRDFSMLMDSGLRVAGSLAALASAEKQPELSKALNNILEDVENGSSLNEALAKHKGVFDERRIAIITAGETGGVLDIVLKRIVELDKYDPADLAHASVSPKHLEAREFAFLCGHLIGVGVPICEALRLAGDAQSPEMKKIVTEVKNSIREGDEFITPLMRHPEYFDPVYLAMVHLGEETGTLDNTLIALGKREL